jgi:hypothetical protein
VARSEPLVDVVFQGAANNLCQFCRYEGVRLVDRALVERERRLQPWVLLAEQVVHGGTQGVDIHPWLGDTTILLGWRVALGADHSPLLSALKQAGDAKVDQPDAPTVAEHDVGGFDIAKDNGTRIVTV